MLYADIIVDISHENLDKSYQYAVPVGLEEEVTIGSLVEIPFGRGNKMRKGYVVGLSHEAKCPAEWIKAITKIVKDSLVIESTLIQLAYWIKENYGSTMNDALRCVIPIKKSVKNKEKRQIRLIIPREEAYQLYETYTRKHYTARARLVEQLLQNDSLDYELVTKKLNISRQTILDLQKSGVLSLSSEIVYRNPVHLVDDKKYEIVLNDQQRRIAEDVLKDYQSGIRRTYLIHGVTGSGKTEVYMEIIDGVIKEGKKVIMLIPEIALTYQTVMRFYRRFGERISVLNSKMSAGERYDQYLRAKNGEIDIMIGPRSALFTPFDNLGLILIDEEHEGSYKSEMPPKYHAREVAIERARMSNASVVLGSATPSLESYKKALDGEYKLYTLPNRAGAGMIPTIHIADLREELKHKNRSIFSRKLKELMLDRLQKHQQIMIFINRRGYAGFVSCRACGHVMKCPHCDVSLTEHVNGKLMCHYCGYEVPRPTTCPTCGSRYIAAFGTGTQKVEQLVKQEFPTARVLRMDTDTTSGKEGHDKILSAFANHEADILVGTQMIVKGHDFPDVTLVGIIAADLSLYANDYRAAERTFQLLLQASGRAGRGRLPGEVVIQTYNPEQYSIVAAAKGDYHEFYDHEMAFRKLLMYPPAANILVVLLLSKDEEAVKNASEYLGKAVDMQFHEQVLEGAYKVVGPAKANLAKANDIYRYVLHFKCEDYELLKNMKDYMEGFTQFSEIFRKCTVQFDFNPMTGY
ncbi:helicase PriA essential for oriC/DnaA-independent DNA replication [Lachnospiraceae bacterium KM106-2]|nr:helicase PriA essential for oriC/DnaA-independent DNA replication [Lachnospiraceae bacterium KM106-2]